MSSSSDWDVSSAQGTSSNQPRTFIGAVLGLAMRRLPAFAVLLLVAALFLSLLAVQAAKAATLQVAASAPDVLATDGTCSLREAIINTNDDAATWPDCPAGSAADTIILSAGTYVLAIPGTGELAAASGDLNVTNDLTLRGAGAESTIINADGIDRVLSVSGASLSVDSLTITGGLVSGQGGGILCNFCDGLSVTNSTISGNTAERPAEPFYSKGHGGGVALVFAQQPATIASSTISGNLAEGGGGVFVAYGSEMTIRESSISENIENSGNSWGGGVLNGAGTVRLVNSTVSGNVGAGVASFCEGDKPCSGGYTAGYNSTISGNSGGGIRDIWGGHIQTMFALQNSIIADQASGADCTGEGISSAGHNLDSDGTCNLTDPTDLPSTDPMLRAMVDSAGYVSSYALLPGSPAIDTIPVADCTYDDDNDPETPEVPLATDQRGVLRPQAVGCDIGAYELVPGEPTPPPTPTPSPTPAATPTPTPTPTPLPVGDLPMCKSKRGKQMTVLVPASKLQRSLDTGLTMGECPDPTNGLVMCKSKRGKLKSMVVPHSKVQRSLDKGMTLGVCRAW